MGIENSDRDGLMSMNGHCFVAALKGAIEIRVTKGAAS